MVLTCIPEWTGVLRFGHVLTFPLLCHTAIRMVWGPEFNNVVNKLNWTLPRRVPQLRQLITSFLLWRVGLDPRSIHVGFVVNDTALEQVFLPVIRLSCCWSFCQCFVVINTSIVHGWYNNSKRGCSTEGFSHLTPKTRKKPNLTKAMYLVMCSDLSPLHLF
jgi:hypothetical protein